MRVVIDASVLAPALISRRGVAFDLMNLWNAGRFDLIVSEHIIDEVIRAHHSRYFYDRGIREGQIRSAEQLLRAKGLVTPLSEQVSGVASHPEDDLVLNTAVSGSADYLVTHDKQLLMLGSYQRIPIVRPGVVVGLLQRELP
jgi:putative PIN family toxin of toxin-antitoxin system